MDKRSITGLVLIAAIMIIFTFLNKNEEEADTSSDKKKTQKKTQISEETAKDSLPADTIVKPEVVEEIDTVYYNSFKNEVISEIAKDSVSYVDLDSTQIDSVVAALTTNKYDEWANTKEKESKLNSKKEKYGEFYPAAEGAPEEYSLENDHVKIVFTTKGAQVKEVLLKNYRSYKAYHKGISAEEQPLVLIDSTNRFAFNIHEMNGDDITDFWTDELYFSEVNTTENTITLSATADNGAKITYQYELTEGKDYELKHKISSSGLNPNTDFESLKWSMKSRHNEKSRSQENQVAGVFYKYNEDTRDLLTETTDDEEEIEASLDWVCFKQAFFSAVLITDGNIDKGGTLKHYVIENEESDYLKEYEVTFSRPGVEANESTEYIWYLGPNDYDNFDAYDNGMHKIMNHGWKIFGWINRNFFLPLYQWLDGFGVNHGIIILLMTLIIRAITTPLVFRNYRSSAKMRLLKPEIEEISKKYPDKADAMKKQQATMAFV